MEKGLERIERRSSMTSEDANEMIGNVFLGPRYLWIPKKKNNIPLKARCFKAEVYNTGVFLLLEKKRLEREILPRSHKITLQVG